MAEVVIPRTLFADILRLIAELRPPPVQQRKAFDCHAFQQKPQETCVLMTESAVSAFDLTSARPDTAHQQVGGSPGLPGTRNGCTLRLNRRPIWWMSVKQAP
jgi:hypothetical protein